MGRSATKVFEIIWGVTGWPSRLFFKSRSISSQKFCGGDIYPIICFFTSPYWRPRLYLWSALQLVVDRHTRSEKVIVSWTRKFSQVPIYLRLKFKLLDLRPEPSYVCAFQFQVQIVVRFFSFPWSPTLKPRVQDSAHSLSLACYPAFLKNQEYYCRKIPDYIIILSTPLTEL